VYRLRRSSKRDTIMGAIRDYYLPGQYIEVSGAPDGDTILETVGDPDHRLCEKREWNNYSSVRIRLDGMTSASPGT
jgi:hypothetical protein